MQERRDETYAKEKSKEREREGEIFSTGEFHSLAVDDEVGQLLGDLSTLLLVLRKVKLLAQLHVKHLHVQVETGQGKHGFTCRDGHRCAIKAPLELN